MKMYRVAVGVVVVASCVLSTTVAQADSLSDGLAALTRKLGEIREKLKNRPADTALSSRLDALDAPVARAVSEDAARRGRASTIDSKRFGAKQLKDEWEAAERWVDQRCLAFRDKSENFMERAKAHRRVVDEHNRNKPDEHDGPAVARYNAEAERLESINASQMREKGAFLEEANEIERLHDAAEEKGQAYQEAAGNLAELERLQEKETRGLQALLETACRGADDLFRDVTDSTALVRRGSDAPAPKGPVAKIDPRALVDERGFDAAQKKLASLDDLDRKLAKRLEGLAAIKGNARESAKEFERIRSEVARDGLKRVLAAFPVGRVLKEKVGAKVAGEVAEAFEHALSLGQRAGRGDPSAENVIGSVRDARKTMIDLASHGRLSESDLKVLKAYDAVARALIAVCEGKGEGLAGKANEWSHVAAEVGGLFSLPVAIGEGVEHLAEDRFARHEAEIALESLGGALGGAWNAEVQLVSERERLAQLRGELQRSVDSYKAVHPRARD